MIAPGSRPRAVVDAAREERFEVLASWDLADEIAEVLARPKLGPYGITVEDFEDVMTLLAPLLPNVEIDVPLRDPEDAPVIASAVAGAADAIVTGDRDLDDEGLRAWLGDRGVRVLTVAELLEGL